MKIGYIEWHDGIGYDLEALKEMNPEEIKSIETLLISRKDQDWRETEALAALNTGPAIEALKDCLRSYNMDVRLFAARYLKEMNIADRVEDIVVETLPLTKIGAGLTFALALAEKYPTERIKQKLLWCCLNGNDDIRVHCAALALFLYGKSSSAIDSSFKIIFEFRPSDRAERLAPFRELCGLIGIDPDSLINK